MSLIRVVISCSQGDEPEGISHLESRPLYPYGVPLGSRNDTAFLFITAHYKAYRFLPFFFFYFSLPSFITLHRPGL